MHRVLRSTINLRTFLEALRRKHRAYVGVLDDLFCFAVDGASGQPRKQSEGAERMAHRLAGDLQAVSYVLQYFLTPKEILCVSLLRLPRRVDSSSSSKVIPVNKEGKQAQLQEIQEAKEAALKASKVTINPSFDITAHSPSMEL